MTLPGGTRFAAAVTSGTSAVRSRSPRSCSLTSPLWSRNMMQRSPSHLTSKRYSEELNGASADAACMGRTSSGKLSSSIWSWSGSCIRPTLGAPRLRSFTTSPCLGRRLLLTGALLLVAQRDLGDRHPTRCLQGATKQVIRLLAQLLRLDVVGAVVVQARLHVVDRDELLDVDGVCGGQRQVV